MWFGWEGDVDAVALGSGGVLQEADTDLFLTELFGGPFVALNLSPRARVYLSGGLTLDFTSIYYQWDDPTGGHIHGYDTGFGDGYYGRTGLEFQVAPGTWFGVGVRRVESSLDPGGQIDHIDLRQTQYLFTFAYSM
jgi:hypothetical protein